MLLKCSYLAFLVPFSLYRLQCNARILPLRFLTARLNMMPRALTPLVVSKAFYTAK
uniref:Uncharacterized protein n=1 Tax=Oryza brachyantha TaxID=4533 RepID=J3NFE3_ORYBR